MELSYFWASYTVLLNRIDKEQHMKIARRCKMAFVIPAQIIYTKYMFTVYIRIFKKDKFRLSDLILKMPLKDPSQPHLCFR